MNMRVKFLETVGYKVSLADYQGSAYFGMRDEWGFSPFVWYGVFNQSFVKLAVL
jgi:hypothetical protein